MPDELLRGPNSQLISSQCPDFHHQGLFFNVFFKLLCKWEFANFPAGSFLLSNRSLKKYLAIPRASADPSAKFCTVLQLDLLLEPPAQLWLWLVAPVPSCRTGKGPWHLSCLAAACVPKAALLPASVQSQGNWANMPWEKSDGSSVTNYLNVSPTGCEMIACIAAQTV